MTSFEEVTRALTEKRVDVTLPILAKVKGSLIPSNPIPLKAPEPSSSIVQVPEDEV